MTIGELEELITKAASIYYSGEYKGVKYDEPIMSDKQFDQYVAWLKATNPKSKILTTGWGYDPKTVPGDKVSHLSGTMESIDRKPRDMKSIPSSLNNNVRISAKLDGLSAKIEIKNGKFVRMSTRGDGKVGIDKTDKFNYLIEHCGGVNFPESFSGEIRGELVISNDNWDKLMEKGCKYSHPRNAATGLINADEISSLLGYVSFIPYKIIRDQSKTLPVGFVDSPEECMFCEWMPGFPKLPWAKFESYTEDDLVNAYVGWSQIWPIDGVVISSYNVSQKENGVRVYDECAYKFESLKKEARVTKIDWQMGKTNKLTPVLNIEPTELDGCTVTHVTAHNAALVRNANLCAGSVIEVMRSGGVIPFLCSVVSVPENAQPDIPEKCPECGEDLHWRGVDVACLNPECGNVNYQSLKVWIHNIAMVDGIADLSIFQYLNRFGIDSLESFYATSVDKFKGLASEGVMAAKFVKLVDKMHNSPVKLNKSLQALNITRMGEVNCKKLSEDKEFALAIQELDNANDAQSSLAAIPSLTAIVRRVCGNATADKFSEEADKVSKLGYLFGHNRIVYNDFSSISANKDFIPVCITGKLTVSRKEFEKQLNDSGYIVKDDISGKTKFLITNEANGTSSKHKKADKLGIPKITEQQMLDMMSGN